MKKIFSLLLCVLVVVGLLVSCDEGHMHTFNDEWKVNETNHWHEATCEHTDVKISEAAHKDENNDKKCDVCGYDYDHSHAWASAWETDATYHWHAVSCGCSIDVSAKAAHVDADNDGVCDTCQYNGGHTAHTYEDVWSYNQSKHWYASNCGHASKKSEADHTPNGLGVCTVCGYGEDGVTLDSAIAAGVANAGKVNGGRVDFVADYGFDEDFERVIYDAVRIYEFGNGYTVVEYEESEKQYFIAYGEDQILGLYTVYEDYMEDWGDIQRDTSATEENLLGVDFSGVIGYDLEFYGVEELIAGLYEAAQSAEATDFETFITDSEDGTFYRFVFLYNYADYQFYEISVAFSLSENFAFENVTILQSVHNAIEVEEGVYQPEYLLSNSVSLFTISQTEGERGSELPYDPAEILLSSFDLVNEDDEPVASLNLTAGDYITLYVKNANDGYLIDVDPLDAYTEDGMAYVDYSFNVWEDEVSVQFFTAGGYTVTVGTETCFKTVEVTVTAPAIEEIYGNLDSETIYVGDSVDINVSVNPYCAPKGFTVEFVGDVDSADATLDGTVFTANTAGTYTLLITSTENDQITCEIEIEVINAPDVSEILQGGYADIWDTSKVVFTPDYLGATYGTLVLTTSDFFSGESVTKEYEYEYTDGFLVLYEDGMPAFTSLTFENYTLSIDGWELMPMMEADASAYLDGAYVISVKNTAVYYVGFAPEELGATSGELIIHDLMFGNRVNYTYSYDSFNYKVIVDDADFFFTMDKYSGELFFNGNANNKLSGFRDADVYDIAALMNGVKDFSTAGGMSTPSASGTVTFTPNVDEVSGELVIATSGNMMMGINVYMRANYAIDMFGMIELTYVEGNNLIEGESIMIGRGTIGVKCSLVYDSEANALMLNWKTSSMMENLEETVELVAPISAPGTYYMTVAPMATGSFKFVASTDGTYIFKVNQGLFFTANDPYTSYLGEDGEYMEVELTAGQTVQVIVQNNNGEELNVVYTIEQKLNLGENTITLAESQEFWRAQTDLTFTADEAGTYVFKSLDYMSNIMVDGWREYDCESDGYSVTLEEGESFTFTVIVTMDYAGAYDTYDCSFSITKEA